MPKGIKKENLSEKICIVCKRIFKWRKKWEKVWGNVKYCSKKCQNNKSLIFVNEKKK